MSPEHSSATSGALCAVPCAKARACAPARRWPCRVVAQHRAMGCVVRLTVGFGGSPFWRFSRNPDRSSPKRFSWNPWIPNWRWNGSQVGRGMVGLWSPGKPQNPSWGVFRPESVSWDFPGMGGNLRTPPHGMRANSQRMASVATAYSSPPTPPPPSAMAKKAAAAPAPKKAKKSAAKK